MIPFKKTMYTVVTYVTAEHTFQKNNNLYIFQNHSCSMEVGNYQKGRKLEKKYKDIFSFKELLSDVKEFEEKLAKMKSGLKRFDSDLALEKEKQTKID